MLVLVNEWIKHADAKIAVTLAFAGAQVAGLTALVASSPVVSTLQALLLLTAGSLLTVALVSGGIALVPRLRHPRSTRAYADPANLLYFRIVAGRYPTARFDVPFARDWAQFVGDDDRLVAALAGQIRANSVIAETKYKWTNVALVMTVLAGMASAAFAAVLVL